MNLQEKIINLSEYKLGFNIYNGYTIINITYPKDWSVIKPENEQITFANDEVNNNMYFYSAPITFDMSQIFDCIDATIEFNKEMERKIQLFQEKQKELQNIFAEESYEVLETLTFSYKKKRKIVKTQSNKNKDTLPSPTEKIVVQEEGNEVELKNEVKSFKQKNKKEKKPTVSSHKKNLELLPGEEVCEDIIITDMELNNGIY